MNPSGRSHPPSSTSDGTIDGASSQGPLATMDAREVTMALLASRRPDATVCPSEVARTMTAAGSGDDWRRSMPDVHHAVDRLLAEGSVRLSWKGKPLTGRQGPYRIGRGKLASAV